MESIAVLQEAAVRDSDGTVHYLLSQNYSRLGDKVAAAAHMERFNQLRRLQQDQALFNAEVARRDQVR